MQERRAHKRFSLKLPARVVTESDTSHGEGTVHALETEDICSGGAFFRTLSPLMKGTRVKIEVVLNVLERSIHCSGGALVKLKGEVLRSEPNGMVIGFERPYRILPRPG